MRDGLRKELTINMLSLTSFLRNYQKVTISIAECTFFHWFVGRIPTSAQIILPLNRSIDRHPYLTKQMILLWIEQISISYQTSIPNLGSDRWKSFRINYTIRFVLSFLERIWASKQSYSIVNWIVPTFAYLLLCSLWLI